MKIKIAGRYFRPELASLFQRLHTAGQKARIKTKTERILGFIRYSLGNDFRDGFRQREHGQDAYQITERELDKLEPIMAAEHRDQEAGYLRESIEAAREFIAQAETRLSGLVAERGSVILLKRQAEIRDASISAERKAG